MELFRLILGIGGATIATYATAWSLRHRAPGRRWIAWLAVSLACWAYFIWFLLH